MSDDSLTERMKVDLGSYDLLRDHLALQERVAELESFQNLPEWPTLYEACQLAGTILAGEADYRIEVGRQMIPSTAWLIKEILAASKHGQGGNAEKPNFKIGKKFFSRPNKVAERIESQKSDSA